MKSGGVASRVLNSASLGGGADDATQQRVEHLMPRI
jgi:hypothetical protein